MSHYMTALAMRQTGIKPATKIVLYWLADHHNSETDECFPSLKALADECEMSWRSVLRHLSALEASGLIRRKRRTRTNGSDTSSAYTLRLKPPHSSRRPPAKLSPQGVQNCQAHNLGTMILKDAGEKKECLRARETFTDDPDGEPF